jgi:hypothetical protein
MPCFTARGLIRWRGRRKRKREQNRLFTGLAPHLPYRFAISDHSDRIASDRNGKIRA